MRNPIARFALAALLVLAVSSTALAADAWIGTWTLDPARSKADPGPLPQSLTLVFEESREGIRHTALTVDAEGKEIKSAYTSRYDGKETPYAGNPAADTAAPKRIDDHHYTNTWSKRGKVTIAAEVTVSEDGKTLTVVQEGVNAEGVKTSNTLVFTRK